MSLDADRIPVIIGTGQVVDHDRVLGPIELAERASRMALDGAPGLAQRIERLSVVNVLARRAGPAPARDLAKALGCAPTCTETTVIGGNVPQLLVTRAAHDIATGRLEATLIAGAEAIHGNRLKPSGSEVEPEREPEPDPVVGVNRQDLSDGERAAGLSIPVFVYPLFESVLAQRAGRTLEQQRAAIGEWMAGFSSVAVAHEAAWFRDPLTAADISAPSPGNRIVAEPYVKRMTAYLGVAQGAAVAVTSLAVARQLGVESDAIFIWGGGDADEVWFPIERPDLGASAGLRAAATATLAASRTGIDDVAVLDLYSCFPSAVQLAASALGVGLDDPRGLTVTGGLPYFGGPGSNYVSHSIATMVERLRDAVPSSSPTLGLVNGVGWYMTKHSVGLYGTEPPPDGFHRGDTASDQRRIDASAVPVATPVDLAGTEGSLGATVDASTVIYDRDGDVVGAPVIATLRDGRRVAAAAAAAELPGRRGESLVGADIDVAVAPDCAPPVTYTVRHA